MNKSTFKKQFPDVSVQEITLEKVLSRKDKEEIVYKLVTGLNTGLITYEDSGRSLKIFTSYRLKHAIDRMTKGSPALDENSGRVGTITSEQPFILGCEMCIRVDFGDSSDVYACSYFAKQF